MATGTLPFAALRFGTRRQMHLRRMGDEAPVRSPPTPDPRLDLRPEFRPDLRPEAAAIDEAGASFIAADRKPKPFALLLVVAAHALVLAALLTQRMLVNSKSQPVAIVLQSIPPPVMPVLAPPPDMHFETPPVYVPAPDIEIAPPTETRALTATTVQPPAPPPAVAAPAARPAAPGVANGGDLSATMLEAPPPVYPLEARRRKEQGVVLLDVLLAPDGRVDEIRISRSSGSPRLDRAALEAVRRWRWSPMIRDGIAVAVRGLVEIPFTLRSERRR